MADRLGILVGGGPAPGINSVIAAVTIEAVNRGLEVIGIYDGFEHLMKGKTDQVVHLTIPAVSRIHFDGGSILRTSRANPTRKPEDLSRTAQSVKELGLRYLVTIGGDDTAFAAARVSEALGGTVRVAHVPKTIDNDIPLPGGMPTFGFETARHVGTELVRNLMEDSRTTSRWYFVVVMGRKAGHLALGIGKAAGATLTVIAEEFASKPIPLSDPVDVLEGAILKRRALGRHDGVAVIAEGIGEILNPDELSKIPGVQVEYDPYGNIRLGEIPLATILKREVEKRFKSRGDKITIVDVTLGYELRCAPPIPFDIDYTRTLGYGAVKFLLSEPEDPRTQIGGLVCLVDGRLQAISFEELRDPATGKTKVRMVDLNSDHYQVSRYYMIRLDPSDLSNLTLLESMASLAKMTVEEFRVRFSKAAGVLTPV
ncbi:MAG: diphosphate--fructose-6-phosphate 1-phosphotransferase [Armatimonadetes bacterium]|nr:diphosphate--fructose-6-phosphate 1-phosphotransferase [Armatimonadota bacterium]MDW8122502.1 diphosphate--fructose-6-phosphate 1-phosphotransferase [Armatimonadota bacterium]